jgi:hypothetical protein
MSTPTESQRQQAQSDFMAAEQIKGILSGWEKAEQERIIRWVSESLGLAVAPGTTGGHVPPLPTPTRSPSSARMERRRRPVPAGGRLKGIEAFVAEKKPKSDQQFAAVVAYFYGFESPQAQRKDTITSADLQEAARLVGWRRFRQPSVTLNNAVSQGYLDRVGRGTFRLNPVGENLVATALPGTVGEGAGPRSTKKRRPRKKTTKKRGKKPAAV